MREPTPEELRAAYDREERRKERRAARRAARGATVSPDRRRTLPAWEPTYREMRAAYDRELRRKERRAARREAKRGSDSPVTMPPMTMPPMTTPPARRLEHLKRFYELLAALEEIVGGTRRLSLCSGHRGWPERGVYFFMEEGEVRTASGDGPRVVRVGTHALRAGSTSRLWGRLRSHKGRERSGSGNHRTSIFRGHVGNALRNRDGFDAPDWDRRNKPRGTITREIRERERPLEEAVSRTIGAMPFLWLAVEDAPGPASLRGYLERNAIALLSEYRPPRLDPPSESWLGLHCERGRVRPSGLWNTNHVDDPYDPAFLDELARLIDRMGAR